MPCSPIQHSTAQHGTARRSTAQHGAARHSAAQRSTAQLSLAQHKGMQCWTTSPEHCAELEQRHACRIEAARLIHTLAFSLMSARVHVRGRIRADLDLQLADSALRSPGCSLFIFMLMSRLEHLCKQLRQVFTF